MRSWVTPLLFFLTLPQRVNEAPHTTWDRVSRVGLTVSRVHIDISDIANVSSMKTMSLPVPFVRGDNDSQLGDWPSVLPPRGRQIEDGPYQDPRA